MTAAEAIDFVRAKRGIVCPNSGFRIQLATYSEQFMGNSAKRTSGISASISPRVSKISEGIAQRIRRFKTGSTSIVASKQIVIEEGVYIIMPRWNLIFECSLLSLKIIILWIRCRFLARTSEPPVSL